MVHVERVDLDAVLLKLRLERTLGSDINPSMRLQDINQPLRYLGIDPFDSTVMMCIERREAHDEVRLRDIDSISLHNRLICLKMIRMQICQFLVAGVFGGFGVPFAGVADDGIEDGVCSRVAQFGVERYYGSVIFVAVDDRNASQRANEGVLDAGAGEDVGFVLAHEGIESPCTFEHTDEHADFGVLASLLEDVMILPSLVVEQRLKDIFLFDENLHLVPIGTKLGDSVFVEIEMGRVTHVNEYFHDI